MLGDLFGKDFRAVVIKNNFSNGFSDEQFSRESTLSDRGDRKNNRGTRARLKRVDYTIDRSLGGRLGSDFVPVGLAPVRETRQWPITGDGGS